MTSYEIEIPEPDGLRIVDVAVGWEYRYALVFGRESTEALPGKWVNGRVVMLAEPDERIVSFETRVANKLREILS